MDWLKCVLWCLSLCNEYDKCGKNIWCDMGDYMGGRNLLCIYVMVLVNLYTCNDLIMSIWDVFGCGENGMSCIKYMVNLCDEKWGMHNAVEIFHVLLWCVGWW